MIQALLCMAVLVPAQSTTATTDANTTSSGDTAATSTQDSVLPDNTPELSFEVTPGVWLLRIQ